MKKQLFTSLFLACALTFSASSQALDHIDLPKNNFIALTFHDVRDDVKSRGDRDFYAISTKNLSAFFDWIKESGWHPISLKQLEQLRLNQQDLPENAVILCFDDGALSSYTHVFPLLQLYQIPAVFAIPTSWINGNTKDAYTAYGEGNLMTWDQMREMQKSGLVEFASHSDDLHKGILANPQNNQKPAAIYRMYLPEQMRYETQQEFKDRIYQDIRKSKQILDQELGIDTKAMIWPYGAVNQEVASIAQEAGLPWSFSLGKSVANDKNTEIYQRVLIIDNPTPEDIHSQVHDVFKGVDDPIMQSLRSIDLNFEQILAENYTASDEKLGQLLTELDVLKNNVLWLDTIVDSNADGVIDRAYFETNQAVKEKFDLLSRADWQARTRVGQYVIANLPVFNLEDTQQLIEFSHEMVKFNPSLNSINLDTSTSLACVWSTASYQLADCQQKIKQFEVLQQHVRQAIHPYLNISGNYFTSMTLSLQPSSTTHIQQVITDMAHQTDLFNLKIDILNDEKTFKNFIQALEQMDQADKQHLHVSLRLPTDLNEKNAKLMKHAFIQLQQQGIQKMGVYHYRMAVAKDVHHWLYATLSLNSSPVTYRQR